MTEKKQKTAGGNLVDNGRSFYDGCQQKEMAKTLLDEERE